MALFDKFFKHNLLSVEKLEERGYTTINAKTAAINPINEQAVMSGMMKKRSLPY
jgi:hypothetical protein